MNFNLIRKCAVLAAVALGMVAADAAPRQPKWLVLNPIKYQSGVNTYAFEGIDKLLLTKLVQARKYKCLDRDEYDTAAREQGFGANVEIVPAGYSMSGEIVQLLKSGKSRTIAGTAKSEYIATVSIRANDLRTQQPYEADTIRVAAYCQTPKDMLVHVVKRMALAILMRDYPPYIMDYDEEEEDITISYGGDFLSVGEQYEVRRRREIVDDDTGDIVYKEKTTGVLEITDVGKNTSSAKLISGKAKRKNVLRFYADPEHYPIPDPNQPQSAVFPKKLPRIAVAPFISKQSAVNVRGLQVGARSWMNDTVSHLDTCLTKLGSFRVLDRSFGPEIDRELQRIISDPNASPNDVCRLSNKLAADYLVVAEVIFSNVVSPGIDYATGLPIPPASAVFAEVRFRCVVAPTTEIAWADNILIDSKYFGGTAVQFSSASAEYAASMIADRIQWRLDRAGYEREQAARAERMKAEAAARRMQQEQMPVNTTPAVPNLF